MRAPGLTRLRERYPQWEITMMGGGMIRADRDGRKTQMTASVSLLNVILAWLEFGERRRLLRHNCES
ncbi:MAG: hypothetical protein ACLQFR_29970 [Streptosporangiaceae bacterium]